MSIDILSLNKYQQNNRAINVALPVLAVECEATPPLENTLDAYEEAVLKFVKIGLSVRSIAVSLNATESLIEEILDSLEHKEYVKKIIGKPWEITEDGQRYFDGTLEERESKNSQYGYMFINAIKKDVLPFFYQGDINKIPLFRGPTLPLRITVEGNEETTFLDFKPKRSKLKDAFKNYYKYLDAANKYDAGHITIDEAVDLFEDLDSFDEEDEVIVTLEALENEEQEDLKKNMFIRTLNCPVKFAYLTMRILLDSQYPGGYRVESPFDFNGIDNNFFLRQIQWLASTETTFIDNEPLVDFLNREIVKVCPDYKNSDIDFDVFVLEKIPLLKLQRNRFPIIYNDMSDIYSLMQRQNSLLDKENIVSNISRRIVESLFNNFFKVKTLNKLLYEIRDNAQLDCKNDGCKAFINRVCQGTKLDESNIHWSYNYVTSAIGRLLTTRGNSIVEKFINVIVLNYYLGTKETGKLLSSPDVQMLYNLADQLNKIRRKVSHDTEEPFTEEDYQYYISHVFELINGLLEAYRED